MTMISASKIRDMLLTPVDMTLFKNNRVQRVIVACVFFVLITILLTADLMPQQVSLEVGQVSESDVVAPRTIAYIDKEKTKRLELEIAQSVSNVYEFDVTLIGKVEEDVANLFKSVRLVQQDPSLSRDQKISKLQGTGRPLSLTALSNLIDAQEGTLVQLEETTRLILRRVLQRGVKAEELDAVRASIPVEPELQVLSAPNDFVVGQVAQLLLRHNFIFNEKETEKRRQQAIASVEPIRATIKKGQVILRRGEVVTSEHITALTELGLQKGQANYTHIAGMAMLVAMMMLVTIIYTYKYSPQVYENLKHMVLLGLIVTMTLLVTKVAHYYSDYLSPMASGALLVAILLDTRLGLIVACLLGVSSGFIAENDFRAASVAIIGGLIGVFSVSRMSQGYTLTRTGFIISLANFVMILASGLAGQIPGTLVLKQGLAGVVSGIGSAILTIGCLPYLESTFKITTSAKLMELAKPNQPLLQRLLVEAPGTYHHSIIVGNLAEAAADLIGADPILVRVGAYYHDIGKIKRPYFFIENQMGENPHDKIAPSLSTLIVTSHVRDGIELAKEHQIPEIVIDLIRQHHGTMLVGYFYHRAVDTEHSECIQEEDFRYEGPRPQTKEAALIMLADCIEAAVRSLSKPTVNRIEATVRKLIRERLHDGQLDECGLTLRDLNTIGDVFIRVLSGIFHSRIEYPEGALKEIERKKVRNGNCVT
jgi:putative nucleotidyltransferase with HDIG domain